MRDVRYGTSTVLDWFVLVDGAAATISGTPTLTLVSGTRTAAPTCSVASNVITATVTTTHVQTDLSLTPRDSFLAQLRVSVTDGSDTHVVDHEEVIFVMRSTLMPSLAITDITSYYAELANSNSLPSGQSTWWFMARLAWRRIRNWLAQQGRSRWPDLIENGQVLRDWHLDLTLEMISAHQATNIGGRGTVWADRAEFHRARCEKHQASLIAMFELSSPTTLAQEPPRAEMTTQRQRTFSGRANGWGGGRF